MDGQIQHNVLGSQDKYLTGNPQITFFKSVYRRHTNFAIESRKLNFSNSTTWGQESTTKVTYGGHLIHKIYLQAQLPKIDLVVNNNYKAFRWLNWVGHKLIKNAELIINGTKIDSQDGEWLHIWNELSQKAGKKEGYAEMVGNVPRLTQIHSAHNSTNDDKTVNVLESYNLYVPLQFWFCKNPGLSLPLISLHSSDIEITITFEKLNKLIWATEENNSKIRVNTGTDIFNKEPLLTNTYLYADYIYLDDDEKKRFINNSHEYLIEQVQERGVQNFIQGGTIRTFPINFTHPIKELIWRIQPVDFTNNEYCQSRGGKQWYNYTDQYDYSGFTGTPEPEFGPGMIGGRSSQNIWYGLPSVKLPFEKGIFEPNFSSDDTTDASDNTREWYWKRNTTSQSIPVSSTSNLKISGYDFISKYHSANLGTDANVYNNKNIENFMGNTSVIQNNVNNNSLGVWANPGSNMRLTDSGKNPTSHATIELGGLNRIHLREGFYFNVMQPYHHHTNIPSVGINVYSFSLDPEDHQPSGSCNFSRIKDSQIIINLSNKAMNRSVEMKVYALSYNIFSIQNGIGKLSFST